MIIYDEINLSVLLHELRSPINAILGIVEHTKRNLNSKAEIENSLDSIKRISNFLLSLSNNYLEISKCENSRTEVEDKQFKYKDLIGYIIDVTSFQFSTKKIEFKTSIMESDLTFIGDSVKIKQILINLLSNAYKYTPNNGCISMDSKFIIESKNSVKLVITIQDNGIGMSKEFLNKVFTPFKCEANVVRPGGTGLGLCIIKENLKQLNGKIKIDSTKGLGTTIKVEIPLKVNNDVYDLSNDHMLVIDDCKITQNILVSYLESVGCICDVASDGEEGLNKFFASPSNYYKAIIVDKSMNKLNGDKVACRIREENRSDAKVVKIIGISASACSNEVQLCKKAGMDDYLLKPLSKEVLLQSIFK